jgi:hypothetical protein
LQELRADLTIVDGSVEAVDRGEDGDAGPVSGVDLGTRWGRGRTRCQSR